MSISEFDLGSAAPPLPPSNDTSAAGRTGKLRLHRLRAVRREQGVSAKRAAQLMDISVEQLRHEEEETTDLTLTQIYQWQQLLEVPVSDLLVEPHAPLSAPVLRRAQL